MQWDRNIDFVDIPGRCTLDFDPGSGGIERSALSSCGMTDGFAQETGSGRFSFGINLFPSAFGHNLSAMDAGTRPKIDDVVGSPHRVLIMFHNDEGVSAVAQVPQNSEEFLIVAGMKSNGGLVQNVKDALKIGAELGREADTLGFSS